MKLPPLGSRTLGEAVDSLNERMDAQERKEQRLKQLEKEIAFVRWLNKQDETE